MRPPRLEPIEGWTWVKKFRLFGELSMRFHIVFVGRARRVLLAKIMNVRGRPRRPRPPAAGPERSGWRRPAPHVLRKDGALEDIEHKIVHVLEVCAQYVLQNLRGGEPSHGWEAVVAALRSPVPVAALCWRVGKEQNSYTLTCARSERGRAKCT